MNTGTGSGSARIDVTPMADVVIVLLLIFMVMAPALAARGVRLPPARHGAGDLAPPALHLAADGRLRLDDAVAWPLEQIAEALRASLADRAPGERVVTLRADRGVDYRLVREALDLCRDAGAERVALATWPMSTGGAR